jgi:formate dehydrogenase major subunit
LGTRLGRGAATMYPRSMADSDCIVIQGSNMAECHPVAFRWVAQAKLAGAKLIHVDPRFTRTSAMADIHAAIRAGSDVVFLGGLVNYVINSERWNTDPFFKEFVVNYTNAATIVSDEFKDTEDLDGVFSGLLEPGGGAKEWPYNAGVGRYDNKSWQYAAAEVKAGPTFPVAPGPPKPAAGAPAPAAAAPKPPAAPGAPAAAAPAPPPLFEGLVRAQLKPPAPRDETLQNPRCVFQIVKRHFSRYTPEMVERATGCPRDVFIKVADTILANSGRDRTTSFAYAVAWTQHTNGVQTIGTCAMLQLLLGNMGRPGAGVMALRGHASIQGSTDLPTLYHSIHGYMTHPSVLRKHDTLEDWLTAETPARSFWANTPKFMVSYLKSMYGEAATRDNEFGYQWHPRIIGDHSHMAMFAAMADGRVKGMLCIGQNPATSLNASLERRGLSKLEWLVVKDNWVTETATFWKQAPEVKSGQVKPQDIWTEVFFFPSSQIAEYEGTFTNTQRMLQTHHKAADPPGDCRSDLWFTHQLAKRLKKLYADSALPRDQGFKHLTWDFDPDPGQEHGDTAGAPSSAKIMREVNGYQTADPNRHLAGFGELRDDGSTTCASWIYCGVFPAPDKNLADRRQADPPGKPGAQLAWGWAWPANRRLLYNRAAADAKGQPWSERKKWVWWDGEKWTGYDVPDFAARKAPDAPAKPDGLGLDGLAGTDPFIMRPDGKGWLFVPAGLVDGPLPVHYEPAESPVKNPLYKQQASPVHKYWKRDDNALAPVGDPRFPIIITTYRLTEHYLAGAMSRWNPWLTELQPEVFVEMSPELAQEKGIQNLDWVKISTPRGAVRAKALVTRRMRAFTIDGKTVHHVGMPWHWGYEGLTTGDAANELTALVGDPNVSIHEGKAFVCNVEKT